jgi:hypothetical protein
MRLQASRPINDAQWGLVYFRWSERALLQVDRCWLVMHVALVAD